MESFWKSRGPDNSTATGIEIASNVLGNSPPKPGLIYGASIASGFMLGAVVTLLFLLRRTKFGMRKREK